jgi:peptide/nickel transport system substrate-binding protein
MEGQTMRIRTISLLLMLLLPVACASPRAGVPSAATSLADQSANQTKRIVISIPNEPVVLYHPLAPTSSRGSAALVYDLVHPGLSALNSASGLTPLLVEAVPSVENGLWKVLDDGRMETTWQLKPGVTWHDGTPLSTDDLAFTIQVSRDRDLATLRNRNYDLIEQLQAPDARTVTVTWSRPFIDADQLFTLALGLPLPKHLLEEPYTRDKATFTDLPYWTDAYVGLGPYKLSQWARGSHLILSAFDGYVPGRPKIREVEARVMNEPNAMMASFMGGTLDLSRGAFLGVEQGLEMRERWKDGRVQAILNNWIVIFPQFLNANPPIVQNLQFRRAMLHAINREEMASTLMAGLVPMAHSPFPPDSREYRATERYITKYDYDPRKAAQLLEGIGYSHGSDGLLRDAQGLPLRMELRTTGHREIPVKTTFPVADAWGQLGITVDPYIIPIQQVSDIETQATFPAFLLVRTGFGIDRVWSFHSAEARVAEKNYNGRNNGRYMNLELDAIIDRYWVTIPWDARMDLVGQIVGHITDQVALLPLFYDMDVMLSSNRLLNADAALRVDGAAQAWNAYEWDVR